MITGRDGGFMNTWLVFFIFAIGLVMIVKGGDLFVDAAIWIAKVTGIPSIIIGATIVSIATTLPELFVSTIASNEGYLDMAMGNAIGSVICNIAFIIGLSACIRPIKIDKKFFGIKGFMMITYLLIFYYIAFDGVITFVEGAILLSLFIIYILMNIIESKRQSENIYEYQSVKYTRKDFILNMIKFTAGALLIIVGAHIMVDSGVKIAQILKIPQQVVSLTLLAIGTSFPELITSLVATIKGEQNISVGNILGANILNLTIVLGMSTLVSDSGLFVSNRTLLIDIPICFVVMFIFVITGIKKSELNYKFGILLLSIYIIYLIFLFN